MEGESNECFLGSGLDLYSASDSLPKALLDPEKGPSYDVSKTAWQHAVGTTKPRWEWLEERVKPEELTNGFHNGYPGPFGPDLDQAVLNVNETGSSARPEHSTFGLAMVGGGRVFGQAHLYGKIYISITPYSC